MTSVRLQSHVCVFLLVVSALFTQVFAHAADSYIFTAADVPGAILTQPTGINDRGQVVGFDREPTGSTDQFGGVVYADHGFLAADGRLTHIDVPGAQGTVATGINNRGQIVGTYFSGNNSHGFLLSHGRFTTIDVPGSASTELRGINDRGDIVGMYGDGIAFLLRHGNVTTIHVPGSVFTRAFGVNNAGRVVGFYQDPVTGRHGFLFVRGAFTTIDAPQSVATEASGINDVGDIVGHYDGIGFHHGFVFSHGHFTNIDVDFQGGFSTNPFGINNSGEIVGEYDLSFEAGFPPHGFVAVPGN